KEDVILDIGAGTGVIANSVSVLCDDIFALEPRTERVEYIKLKFPEVKAFQGSAENVQQFPDSYFTKIYAVSALHHFDDQDSALAEFHRLLKQGGLLLIHEMNPESRSAKIEKQFSKKVNFIAPEKLQEKLELAGFRVKQLEKTKKSGYFILSSRDLGPRIGVCVPRH
ncbi:MAG: class I SAM-dependent methyltransferase, partial [Nitrososphaerales archaeon]